MMPRMRWCGLCSLAMVLAACAGVSPDPARADPTSLPRPELTPSERDAAVAAVDRAMSHVLHRRFDAADDDATAALTIDPRNARALAIRGYVKLHRASMSDPPDAFTANGGEHDLRTASLLAPEDSFVGWLHAVFLADSGHLSAAAHAAEQALLRVPNAPPQERAALLGIAGTYRYELGEERRALVHLREYVTLRPDDATAHFRLGACLLAAAALPPGRELAAMTAARDDAAAAVLAFTQCSELSPGDEDAALAIATAHWRAAELAEQTQDGATAARHRQAAEDRLRLVAERFPASAEPWFRLGVAAEAREANDHARTAYERALKQQPDHVPSLLNLAALQDRTGDAAGATQLLQRALTADAAKPQLESSERRRLRTRIGATPGS
jgi:Flp pilus assembly protein TadD